jgi:hypothetical protein
MESSWRRRICLAILAPRGGVDFAPGQERQYGKRTRYRVKRSCDAIFRIPNRTVAPPDPWRNLAQKCEIAINY